MPKGYRRAFYNIFWLFNCHSNAFNLKKVIASHVAERWIYVLEKYQMTREWKYLIATEKFAYCPDNPFMIVDNVIIDRFYGISYWLDNSFEVGTCTAISSGAASFRDTTVGQCHWIIVTFGVRFFPCSRKRYTLSIVLSHYLGKIFQPFSNIKRFRFFFYSSICIATLENYFILRIVCFAYISRPIAD